MPKFNVYAKVVGTKYIGEYEAETKEAAIAMAERDASASLCHQCSSECEDPECEDLVAEEVEENRGGQREADLGGGTSE